MFPGVLIWTQLLWFSLVILSLQTNRYFTCHLRFNLFTLLQDIGTTHSRN